MSNTPARGRELLRGLVALFLLAGLTVALCYGLWIGAEAVLAPVTKLESENATALIAASGTIMAAVLTVVYNQRRSKDREIAESHRDKKAEVYGVYMKVMTDLLAATKKGEKIDTEDLDSEVVKTFYGFKRDLIVWGSPGAIKAYLRLESEGWPKGGREGVVAWDALLREIRKDLGNSNWRLQRGDLVRMFLNQEAQKALLSRGS